MLLFFVLMLFIFLLIFSSCDVINPFILTEEYYATSDVQGSQLKILFLSAGVTATQLVSGLEGMNAVASVDIVDGSLQTPSLAVLKLYDVIIAVSSSSWYDSLRMGNALAEYVDQGGKLILCAATIHSAQGVCLSGRVVEPNYSPVTVSSYDGYSHEAYNFVFHQITSSVSFISSYKPVIVTAPQGSGKPLGYYESGYLVGAYNPLKPIVVFNLTTDDGLWGGDVLTLMENALNWLSDRASVFDSITFDDILNKSSGLSNQRIDTIYGSVEQILPGQVILYKTSSGNYGKMEIVDYAYDLRVRWVTYEGSSGNVIKSGDDLMIRGTWLCDLDAGSEVGVTPEADFHWGIQSAGVEQYIDPKNGALFTLVN
jgi:hypothetical protein